MGTWDGDVDDDIVRRASNVRRNKTQRNVCRGGIESEKQGQRGTTSGGARTVACRVFLYSKARGGVEGVH